MHEKLPSTDSRPRSALRADETTIWPRQQGKRPAAGHWTLRAQHRTPVACASSVCSERRVGRPLSLRSAAAHSQRVNVNHVGCACVTAVRLLQYATMPHAYMFSCRLRQRDTLEVGQRRREFERGVAHGPPRRRLGPEEARLQDVLGAARDGEPRVQQRLLEDEGVPSRQCDVDGRVVILSCQTRVRVPS